MKSQNIFPDLTQSYTGALEDKPVLLDGRKVLFDKKVALLPVELKQKKAHGQ